MDDSFESIVRRFLNFQYISPLKKSIKEKREYETNLIFELCKWSNKADVNKHDNNRVTELQNKLDRFYLERAKSAFIRSHAKWIEEGEKNSAYFSNLEESRWQRYSICSFMIQGEEYKDYNKIEKEISMFYS